MVCVGFHEGCIGPENLDFEAFLKFGVPLKVR